VPAILSSLKSLLETGKPLSLEPAQADDGGTGADEEGDAMVVPRRGLR
jgi:hypothetical protein